MHFSFDIKEATRQFHYYVQIMSIKRILNLTHCLGSGLFTILNPRLQCLAALARRIDQCSCLSLGITGLLL